MSDAGGKQSDRSQFFPLRGFGLGNAELLGSFLDLLLQGVRPLAQLRLGIPQGHRHGIEGARKLAELVPAPHRNRLFQIPGRDPLRPGFQVAQRQIDQTVDEKAYRERGDEYKPKGKGGDRKRIPADPLIHSAHGIADFKDTEHRGILGVLMAGGVVAGGLIADHLHAAQQTLPLGGREGPCPLALGNLFERLLGRVAERTAFGLAVYGLADLGGIGRMRDLAFLAEDPDPVDTFLLRDVADDRVHIGGLILKHCETQCFW